MSDPISDPRVQRVALSLPLAAWIRDRLSRSVARRVAKGVLAEKVRLRRARGAQGSNAWRAQHPRKQQLLDVVEEVQADLDVAAMIDCDHLRDGILAWPTMDATGHERWDAGAGRLLGIAMFAAWCNRRSLSRQPSMGASTANSAIVENAQITHKPRLSSRTGRQEAAVLAMSRQVAHHRSGALMTSSACAKSSGYSDSNRTRSPVPGCSNSNSCA